MTFLNIQSIHYFINLERSFNFSPFRFSFPSQILSNFLWLSPLALNTAVKLLSRVPPETSTVKGYFTTAGV